MPGNLLRATYGEEAVGSGQAFHIVLLEPDELDRQGEDPQLYASALHGVVHKSWLHKFTPEPLTPADVSLKVGSAYRQLSKITHPTNFADYWLAYNKSSIDARLTDVGQAKAMAKVETYKPRNPFKHPYPNITDLETDDGHYLGEHEKHAAALLYFSLHGGRDDSKVSYWGEKPNQEARDFMGNIGFVPTGNEQEEKIGAHALTYVHFEAESKGAVIIQLAQQYPWLKQTS